MVTQWDKAIAALVMALVGLGTLIWHWQVPGWLTETNVTEALVVLTPVLVWLVPNRGAKAKQVGSK